MKRELGGKLRNYGLNWRDCGERGMPYGRMRRGGKKELGKEFNGILEL
jgi:hypothetical protein